MLYESRYREYKEKPFKASILAQFHTLSFIFSVEAIDTQLYLHEYETTITIQHNGR